MKKDVLTGNCYICGAELGKAAMKNHLLKTCFVQEAGQETLFLKVEGACDKNYWLYLDISLTATLAPLDNFLREIWLECCGHMSGFYSGVWFNTPRLAAAHITQRFSKFGIKPDGIINFLSNEPPFGLKQR